MAMSLERGFQARAALVLRGSLPLLFVLTAAPPAVAGSVQVPLYFGLQPGSATKAEVDLTLGEPLSRREELVYDYAPPPGVSDTARVTVAFFPDTMQVARLDVHLKVPLDPGPLRPEFGNRVMLQDRPGGGQEEIFYPRLHALVFQSKAKDTPASAISYLSPRFVADLYVDRFNERRREGRDEEARTEADKAVAVDPDYARGYVAQGAWLESKGSHDEAIVRYLAGTNAKYSPRTRGRAHARLATLYWSSKGWPDKAEAELKRALAVAPDLAFAHVSYGRFLRSQKRLDDALARFAKAIELDANDADARAGAADVHWTRQEFAKARPHLEAAARWLESPTGADASVGFAFEVYFRLGYCLGEAKEHARSLEVYQKAETRDPRNAALINNVAWAYLMLGKPEEAARRCQAGLALAPKDFFLNKTMGNALLDLGRFDEALRHHEASLEAKPNDAWQAFNVARSWAALHKKKPALMWLDKALAAGFRNRSEILADPHFAWLRGQGDFKKLLARIS